VTTTNKSNILVATLGGSWQVIPEMVGLLDPRLPLFPQESSSASDAGQGPILHRISEECGCLGRKSPQAGVKSIEAVRIDEVWIVTTDHEQSLGQIEKLKTWVGLLDSRDRPITRFFLAEGTSQLTVLGEVEAIRELIFRTVLHATEHGRQRPLLCLAGGRKTMSADLQRAATFFGANELFHVVLSDDGMALLTKGGTSGETDNPRFWARPLPEKLVNEIHLVRLGGHEPSSVLGLRGETVMPISAEDYDLSIPEDLRVSRVMFNDGEFSLTRELDSRSKDSHNLLANYFAGVVQDERRENWRGLYRLQPVEIEILRSTVFGREHENWFRRIPKADLHCHIGGILDLEAQRRAATAIWREMKQNRRARALDAVQSLLQTNGEWPWKWPQTVKTEDRAGRSAALLIEATDEQLDRNLWKEPGSRFGLGKTRCGFPAYERPGELSGSAVLYEPAAVEAYAQEVIAYARRENLAYLELRGSPNKYLGSGFSTVSDWLEAFRSGLERARERVDDPTIRFLVIVDRRKKLENVRGMISEVIQFRDKRSFVAGFDVAGEESWANLERLEDAFHPAFEACLPLTIHAGEGTPVEGIWNAAYRLHADRIGHGLTLMDKPELARKFRDRGIAVEMCPTSNIEVIGFEPPYYPLKAMWEEGLAVTVNTDNPAFGKTNPAHEFVVASELCGGLKLWEILAIAKQSFVHAFLPANEKEKHLKAADREALDAVQGALLGPVLRKS